MKNAHAWLMARRERGPQEGLGRTKYAGKSKAWPERSRRHRKGTSPKATGPWRRDKDFPWRCNFPLAMAGVRKSRLSAIASGKLHLHGKSLSLRHGPVAFG